MGLETAFAIVELGRLACVLCRPGFSLGHLDQVHDRVLDALVGPDLDQRLLARAAAHLDVLVRDDLLRRHRVVKDDLAFDRSAARDRARFVGACRDGDRPCEDDRGYPSSQCEMFHGYPPQANFRRGLPEISNHKLSDRKIEKLAARPTDEGTPARPLSAVDAPSSSSFGSPIVWRAFWRCAIWALCIAAMDPFAIRFLVCRPSPVSSLPWP